MISRLFPVLPIAALAACSPAAQPQDELPEQLRDTQAVVTLPDGPPEDCLLMVWSNQEERDVEFDRANDAVEGGAISCATGTSASQFRAAIASLREAARSGDKARILEQLGIPLLYIDAEGERRELSRDEIDTVFDEVFDARMIEVLSRLDLADMTVETDGGGFFELGSLWLVVDKDGGRPRLMTVNRQALDEALEAARDGAERKEGEELPQG